MENVLRKAEGHRYCLPTLTLFTPLGVPREMVTAAFSAIERESTKIGLVVNEGKTKQMETT